MKGEQKLKAAIVAPCHIPPSPAWVKALEDEQAATGARIVIVDDSDGNLGELPHHWEVFGYDRQREFLGELYDEFARMFHKSSACRVFGHLWALEQGYDVVIGLDSDCIVKPGFVMHHTQFMGRKFGSGWFNPIGNTFYSRGFPYSQRDWPVVANMGLWENVLDINGKDRQSNEPKDIKIAGSTVPVAPFPFSGMNFALAKEAIPGFLFLPNFDYGDSKFRRVDDIWGGYIFQKMMRLRHESAMVGYPFVFHDTVVIAEEDAAEEQAMYDYEDEFIHTVDLCFERMLSTPAPLGMIYADFRHAWEVNANAPFTRLQSAFDWWVAAIKKYA